MSTRITSILGVVLGALALVVAVASRSGAPNPTGAATSASTDTAEANAKLASDVQVMQLHMQSMEDTITYQAKRINALEAALAGRPAVAGADASVAPGSAEDLARLKDDVHSLMVGEAVNSDSGKEHLKEAVRQVQEELRTEQRQQWQQQAAQAMKQADSDRAQRWKDFAQTAHLDYQQEQTLLTAVNAETEKRQALMQQLQDGSANFRDLRPQLRDLRDQTDAQVKTALTAEQFQQYQQARDDERQQQRGAFGGGFGGAFGGGRGGRGQ